MRIIAGRFKGRVLERPPREGVRPTSDRLRETLFNVVDVPEGCRVLDGFAGTGALGFEALSRGAAQVTFVDRDARAVKVIRANATRLGVENACAIIRSEFGDSLNRFSPADLFDLVLLDPPYDLLDYNTVIRQASTIVAPGGTLVVEHSRRQSSPDPADGLARYRIVAAGDSQLSLYRAAGTDAKGS